MDNLNITPETAASLQNLSAKDKQELNQFVLQEGMPSTPTTSPQSLSISHVTDIFLFAGQKAQIQQTVHALTDMCFRKCVTSKISSGSLDRSEEPCMRNCVDRYMDANMTVIKHLEQMRTL
jgi:import inner membrane translocase subunit TIM8